MTTPTKTEIEERARELYFKAERDRYITPTSEELAESGYMNQAKCELIRNEARHDTLSYLESMANEYGLELVKRKNQYTEDLEIFPIDVIMKEGAFTVGGRGSGKTNLLKLLVMEALTQKIEVKVIDSCLSWKGYPLPTIRIKRDLNTASKWNCVYDLSRLSVLEIRAFVSNMVAKDVEEAIMSTDMGRKPKCLYVLEEIQNVILPNSLRNLKFQEISRFVTQGRNFGLSYIASTQRLASTDVNLVEISGVKYWFKLEGFNNLVKARAWLNKYTVWNLRNLEVGRAYLQIGSKIKLLRLPLFTAKKVLA